MYYILNYNNDDLNIVRAMRSASTMEVLWGMKTGLFLLVPATDYSKYSSSLLFL